MLTGPQSPFTSEGLPPYRLFARFSLNVTPPFCISVLSSSNAALSLRCSRPSEIFAPRHSPSPTGSASPNFLPETFFLAAKAIGDRTLLLPFLKIAFRAPPVFASPGSAKLAAFSLFAFCLFPPLFIYGPTKEQNASIPQRSVRLAFAPSPWP